MRSINQFPAITSSRTTVDPIERAARRLSWRSFQRDVIRHVTAKWDRSVADEFNEFAAARLAVPSKPIDFKLNSRRLLGRHARDAISLNPGLNDEGRWRTLSMKSRITEFITIGVRSCASSHSSTLSGESSFGTIVRKRVVGHGALPTRFLSPMTRARVHDVLATLRRRSSHW
jgi:hypothetical protein